MNSKEEYYEDMDLEDVRNAVGLAGLPDELRKLIWKPKTDDKLLDDYLKYKKGQNG